MVPKSGHVTITKIENLHMGTCRKIQWFQKCYYFRSTTKSNEIIAAKPSQNCGVTWHLYGRLAVFNWRSSSIHPSCLYLCFYSVA